MFSKPLATLINLPIGWSRMLRMVRFIEQITLSRVSSRLG
ncbi:glycyl-tRNA synthetase 1 [Cryptococcus neoformans]|nr:glycyl-tRNA synthetase 1 [Cryptococcus neoformans var. grubii]